MIWMKTSMVTSMPLFIEVDSAYNLFVQQIHLAFTIILILLLQLDFNGEGEGGILTHLKLSIHFLKHYIPSSSYFYRFFFLFGISNKLFARSCPSQLYSNEDKHQNEEILNCPQCSIWKKNIQIALKNTKC